MGPDPSEIPMHSLARLAPLGLLALAAPVAAQNPATLALLDGTSGEVFNDTGFFRHDHDVAFLTGGDPGEIVLLVISPLPGPSNPPVLFNGVPIGFDLTFHFVLANGFLDPSGVVGAGGFSQFNLTIPETLPVGAQVYAQSVLISLTALDLRLTNTLDLKVSCGNLAPTWVSTSGVGSAATTPMYANALAVTVNDPEPKFVGPGHLFTAGVDAQILLAPVSAPEAFTHAHTWSGGDPVGWFRDRFALDGSTPGIDRIFFVARDTTDTPNFVDWDGAAFSNETSLAPVAGSIQRLCVTDEGDLIGNDYFGNVYLWDKQAGYAQSFLFQFTNDPTSVPWGSSLDGALGKIAYDPVSGLVLLPVRNEDVSLSGQLYGFDLAGNRLFVDQDLFETPLTGFNSARIGVTVDLADPECRVLAHGGRDQGTCYFARFGGGMQSKAVAAGDPDDKNGGWIGALVGGELWTNTNTLTYGLVRRALPSDW